MRLFAVIALFLAAASGFLAWNMLALDLNAYNDDQRTVLQLMFNMLGCFTIGGPILALVALRDDANARKRRPQPRRSYRASRR